MVELPEHLKKIAAHEDALYGVALSWLVGVPVAALLGFYATTVLGVDHRIDLQLADIQLGFMGALAGAGVGVVFALVVTLVYPHAVEREELRTPHEDAHFNPMEQ